MYLGLLRKSCLAVCLAWSVPSVLADDVVSETTEPSTLAGVGAGSEASLLLLESKRAADLLDQASRQVLAGPGDRSTAAARREAASRLAALADAIRKDTYGIKTSEADYIEAVQEFDDIYAETLEDLDGSFQDLKGELEVFREDGQPSALTDAVPLMLEARDALRTSLVDGARFRSVNILIELPSGEYDPVIFETVATRLEALSERSGFELARNGESWGPEIELSGKVPSDITPQVLRRQIEALFADIEPETEEDEAIDLPDPAYLAITLD